MLKDRIDLKEVMKKRNNEKERSTHHWLYVDYLRLEKFKRIDDIEEHYNTFNFWLIDRKGQCMNQYDLVKWKRSIEYHKKDILRETIELKRVEWEMMFD